jgi:hypothetical protein
MQSNVSAPSSERLSRGPSSSEKVVAGVTVVAVLALAGLAALNSDKLGMLLFVPAMTISLAFQAIGVGEGLTSIFVVVHDGFPSLTLVGVCLVYVVPVVLLLRMGRRSAGKRA